MTNSVDIVIAASLVALVLVFIRISWTLKEINDSLISRTGVEVKRKTDYTKMAAVENAPASEEVIIDETEIAAVIAIASQAMRAAV